MTERLFRQYGAFQRQGSDWIGALCPCGHTDDHPGSHFFYNERRAIGNCFGRHGRLQLVDLCAAMNIDPREYGGVYKS